MKTYVRAAGIRVAQQNEYTDFSGNVIAWVTWEHRDASGLSGRSSYENGSAETLEGSAFAPVETDAIGNNMGTRTPYIEPPPGSGGSPEMEFDYRDQQTYINGQQITCSLDGVPVKCSAVNSLPNGSIEDVRTYGVSTLDLFQLGIIERVTVLDEPGVPDKKDPKTGEDIITVKTAIKVEWEVTWNRQRQTQTQQQQTQTNEHLFSVEDLRSAARKVLEEALKNPKGDCAKLLGKDALSNFDKISNNIEFDGNIDVGRLTEGGRPTTLAENPSLSAVTIGQDIYLNPQGFAFRDLGKVFQNEAGKQFVEIVEKMFRDSGASNQREFAVALIIHEFLHTTGKFKVDVFVDAAGNVDSSRSQKNQRKVLENCFKK